jgi:hypothetical protein
LGYENSAQLAVIGQSEFIEVPVPGLQFMAELDLMIVGQPFGLSLSASSVLTVWRCERMLKL